MTRIEKNIENLKSLWRLVGERASVHHSTDWAEYSLIKGYQWPNRLWFMGDITEAAVAQAKALIQSEDELFVLPYWDVYHSNGDQLLKENGFELLFEQLGMSLELEQKYDAQLSLKIKKVSTAADAALWSELFEQSFGYQIHQQMLQWTYDTIDYWIAYDGNTAVGTLMLHYTGDTIGIHAMGILPEMRRQGFAEQMMVHTLNHAIDKDLKYATLQASALGKGLYAKLGFEEDFVQRNYRLMS